MRFSDERLLDLRLCDLGLGIERTPLARATRRLYAELEERGIRFKPHVWLSSEWFSPDGVPGIAIPFFLAHPRLTRLEAKKMLEVEGGTEASCMRILRHEAGHALDTAYRLHFRKSWREIFGRYSEPYPDYYRPKPNSRNYVLHLDSWYAQAHPAEDFAETFAVWLKPGSEWRRRYREWPAALRKLEYVDEAMREISGSPPRIRSRATVEPVTDLRQTLREYYEKKRDRYGVHWSDFYDRDLRRLFTDARNPARRLSASRFLRSVRKEVCETVSQWTGAHTYTVDQVLAEMIERCRELKLRLARPAREARQGAVMLLIVHTMHRVHVGRHEIPI